MSSTLSQSVFNVCLPHCLIQDASNLDCELIIKTCIRRHSRAILRFFRDQICNGPWRRYIAHSDGAVLLDEGQYFLPIIKSGEGNNVLSLDETPTLRLTLFKDQILYVSIDTRSGRFVLRDAGDLAAWERGYRFARYADRLNDNPAVLLNAIVNLRFNVSNCTVVHEPY